jgi:TM2 domain-containing membrane protein YozV/type II secretory pathway pseudopilin PulG
VVIRSLIPVPHGDRIKLSVLQGNSSNPFFPKEELLNTPVSQTNVASPSGRAKGPLEKFCSACGEVINKQADPCPKCGARQRQPLSKTALVLITFFLGSVGAHKFYVGKTGLGVLYLLFCWTGIPGIIAFIEFIIYLVTDEEELRRKYPECKGNVVAVVVVAIVVMVFIVVAILAAVAIPLYMGYVKDARINTANNIGGSVAALCGACKNESGTLAPNLNPAGGGTVGCSGTSSENQSITIPGDIIVTITPSGDGGGTVTARYKTGQASNTEKTFSY